VLLPLLLELLLVVLLPFAAAAAAACCCSSRYARYADTPVLPLPLLLDG
jgi:hypothetical protein